jgi:uncharacterized protein (TIGR03067 family)
MTEESTMMHARHFVTALALVSGGLLGLWGPVSAAPEDSGTKGPKLPAADLDQLQGEWRLESGVREGKEMPAEMRRLFKCIIQANKFTITREGKPVEEGTLNLDATARPKTIDFDLGKGKWPLGIYEVNGEIYKVCYASTGKDRPDDFTAKEGSGRTLSVWRRIKA